VFRGEGRESRNGASGATESIKRGGGKHGKGRKERLLKLLRNQGYRGKT